MIHDHLKEGDAERRRRDSAGAHRSRAQKLKGERKEASSPVAAASSSDALNQPGIPACDCGAPPLWELGCQAPGTGLSPPASPPTRASAWKKSSSTFARLEGADQVGPLSPPSALCLLACLLVFFRNVFLAKMFGLRGLLLTKH